MLRNYFKTAYRFLLKNKTYSFINIFGLAVGTLCCLYIVLYVEDQYSYDKHYKDADHIYRITTSVALMGDKHTMATSSPAIAPAMKKDFGEVEQSTRVVPAIDEKQHLLRYKEKSLYETDPLFVDSTFFDVFNFHFIYGDIKTALLQPYSVVLLQPTANKLFGSEDPTGKVITIDNAYGKHDFKVTGVVDESMGKSHIHGNLFISMNSGGIGSYMHNNNNWAGNNIMGSYIKLLPHTDAADLEKKLPAFLEKYGAQQLKSLGMEKHLHLQPIASIHTTEGYEWEPMKTVSPSFLYILVLIAALIQLIACINFMNLSTARAAKRAKEVGVRKVIGAGRGDLIRQFLSESFILSLVSVLIALPLLLLLTPYINRITHADIHLSLFAHYEIWALLTGIVLITGLVAGSYPAFYLSAFQAIKVIKGNFTNHISANGIRRSLVVFQFCLSIGLTAGIIVIYSQLQYVKNMDLGFDKNQKLIFSFFTEDAKSKVDAFRDDLRRLAEVKAASKSNHYLSQVVFDDNGVFLAGGDMAHAIDAQNMVADENFVKANGIQLISGRDFRLHDSDKVLINETLVKKLGLRPESAPGTRLYSQYMGPVTHVDVVGVMKDFNYSSLHEEVRPFLLSYNPNKNSHLIVAVSSSDYKQLLGKIGALWHKDMPSVPFEYTFLDAAVQQQYESEITLSNIIDAFTGMAILISSLGLFGLAAFSAEQRSKEIGIRKVLGANVSGIVQLLSKDFLRLVIIAFIIATPIAWWAMNKWLQTFAYRISVSWWMFTLAGLLTILIALGTVSFQAIKAAIVNPIKSLKSE